MAVLDYHPVTRKPAIRTSSRDALTVFSRTEPEDPKEVNGFLIKLLRPGGRIL
jgi:hypothetical protein